MGTQRILVVDDEKNIRLTLAQALESSGLLVQTAGDGEEALQKLTEEEFNLVLLDLKLPGLDGLEVLRRIRQSRPKLRVIIITAHGTIEYAVEALKAGAVDFLPKPFSPNTIREIVWRVLARPDPQEKASPDYRTLMERAGSGLQEGDLEAAGETARQAIALDPARPEAYNLLGALLEMKHDPLEAQRFYRAALEIDPTYEPAGANLDRITLRRRLGPIDLGKTGKKER